jgi:hypothetical protein
MSRVHYPSFLVYNLAGGITWGSGFTILGYLAGASYKQVEKIAGRIGFLLLAIIVISLILSWLLRQLGERSRRLEALGERLAATSALVWVRTRFPAQVTWTHISLSLLARPPAHRARCRQSLRRGISRKVPRHGRISS